jgi:hypothetical protein
MGSDFGGDQRGQEFCNATYSDGTQTAASKKPAAELGIEVTSLCIKIGANVQRKKSMGTISLTFRVPRSSSTLSC